MDAATVALGVAVAVPRHLIDGFCHPSCDAYLRSRRHRELVQNVLATCCCRRAAADGVGVDATPTPQRASS